MSDIRRACLYICTTCTGVAADGARTAADYDEAGEQRPGAMLYDAVKRQADGANGSAPFDVHPVVCLANCEQGCSVAVAEPGKWGYLLGHIGPEVAEDLFAYCHAYAASGTGTVMRRQRPDSLHHAIVARFPVPGNSAEDEAFHNRTVTK